MEPEILLADESTGNLDSETGQQIWGLLKKINAEMDTTINAVTHWGEASNSANRTIHLRSGIRFLGKTDTAKTVSGGRFG
jgi:ABC-type lipoprotein export system ATPase subunit